MFINVHTHGAHNTEESVFIENIIIDNSFLDNISEFNFEPHRKYSVGLHPWYISEERLVEQLYILDKIANNPQVKAIGECGFDKIKGPEFKVQEQVFMESLKTAERVDKPIIIHCVKAFSELTAIHKLMKPKVPMVVHGFNKNLELALDLIKKGFYLSFGKELLSNEKLLDVFDQCDLTQVFLETDDSDISIKSIYAKAATKKNITIDKLEEIILENYSVVFK
jgi:TatD DNase family protein